MSRTLHILWSPQGGPIFAYRDPTLAWTHARTMLGVDVAQVEERETLPAVVLDDLEAAEFDESADTPVIAVDEIDDTEPR